MATRRTLDFEDLAAQGGTAELPSGYGGFVWHNAFAIDDDVHPGSGYVAAIRSGETAGYNGGGRPMRFALEDGRSFGFRGLDAAAAWNNDLEIVVQGFRDGVLVATAAFTLDPIGERIRLVRDFDRDFLDVDEVMIATSGGTNARLGGSGRNVAFDDLILIA